MVKLNVVRIFTTLWKQCLFGLPPDIVKAPKSVPNTQQLTKHVREFDNTPFCF